MNKKLIIRNIYKSFLCDDTIGFGDFIKGSLYLYNYLNDVLTPMVKNAGILLVLVPAERL